MKTPLVQCGILALALVAIISNARRLASPALLPHFLLIAIYSAAAVGSEINLGLRHLLPIFPSLFILGGAAGHSFAPEPVRGISRGIRYALPALRLVLVAEVAYRFANYLAYFNGLVRPVEGFRHLIDSSVDWGQELPALKRRIGRGTDPAPHFVAYSGTASPQAHGITVPLVYSHLEGDRAAGPALKFIFGPQDDVTLTTRLREMPSYDPSLVFPIRAGGDAGSMVVKHASALRLHAGTYFISASLLAPVHHPRAFGFWTAEHESTYQSLRETMTPLLADHRATRAAAVNRFPPETWNRIVRDFEEYRFARLAAWLWPRKPDDHVNFAILVFRLFFVSARFRLPLAALATILAGGAFSAPAFWRRCQRRQLMALSAAVIVAAVLAFSRFNGVRDQKTFVEDHALLARAAERTGKFELAWTEATAALALNPQHPDALRVAVIAYFKQLVLRGDGLEPEAKWLELARAFLSSARDQAPELQAIAAVAVWRANQRLAAVQEWRRLGSAPSAIAARLLVGDRTLARSDLSATPPAAWNEPLVRLAAAHLRIEPPPEVSPGDPQRAADVLQRIFAPEAKP